MANGGTIQFGIKYNVDQSGLNNAKKSLQEIQSLTTKAFAVKTGQGLDQAEKELNEIKKTAADVERALDNAFSADLGTYNLSKLNQSLKNLDLNKVYNQFSRIGTEGQAAFRKVLVEATTTTNQIRRSHKVLDDFAKTMRNTVQWSITSSIMNTFTGSVEKAYGYVKNLDSSLNDIRIVTNLSAEEMDKFAVKANKAAKALGSSTLDYTKASLIYYQQGLSEQEVEARANVTLKAANVTGQSGEAVSEQLTAIWNGYKVSAEEAELYIDKVSAVAASTAADLEELSTGMSKVASAANAMGVDIDQLNAQLATIVSVTRQAPESVGTALKTIYARMSDLKLGETDEDGLGLGDVTGTMESMGIEVLDATGNLRDMGIVIENVAEKWDTWTEAQKTAMAQVLAGKRQYNNLVALFENWDMYTDALETSENATGTLAEQNEIYLESVEAHLQQLSTAAEDAYDSMFNADSFKSLIDLGTGLVTVFGDFIDAIGGGGTALTALGGIGLRVFKNQISDGITTSIHNLVGLKNNLKKVKEQSDFSQTLKDFSFNTENLDETSKKIIEINDALSTASAKGLISNDEQEQLQSYIKELDKLQKKLEEIDKQKKDNKQDKQDFQQEKEEASRLLANISNGEDQISETDWETIKDVETQDKGKKRDITPEQKQSYEEISKMVQSQIDQYTDFEKKVKEAKQAVEQLADAQIKFAKVDDVLVGASTEDKKDNNSTVNKNWQTAWKNLEVQNTTVKDKIRDLIDNAVELPTEEIGKDLANQLNEAMQKAKNLINSGNEDFTDADYSEVFQELVEAYADAAQDIQVKLEQAKITVKATAEGVDADYAAIDESLDEQKKNLQENVENVDLDFKSKVKQINLEETISQITNLIGSVTDCIAAFQMLANIGDIWSDDTLTDGEKVLQTITAIGTALMIGIPSVFGFTTSLQGLAATAAASTGPIAAASAAINSLIWPLTLIAVAIGGVIAVSSVLSDLFVTVEERAKKTEEAFNEEAKRLDELKNAYDEVISSIENYKDAEQSLLILKAGTEEWSNAVQKLNLQVLELLDKYPELAKYVSQVGGKLSISEEGLDFLEQSTQDDLDEQQRRTLLAQKSSNTANFNAKKARFNREGVGSVSEFNADSFIKAYQEGGIVQLNKMKQEFQNRRPDISELQITQYFKDIDDLINAFETTAKKEDLLTQQIGQAYLQTNKQFNNLSEKQQAAFSKAYEAQLSQEANKIIHDDWNSYVEIMEGYLYNFIEEQGYKSLVSYDTTADTFTVKDQDDNSITLNLSSVIMESISSTEHMISALNSLSQIGKDIVNVQGKIVATEMSEGGKNALLSFAGGQGGDLSQATGSELLELLNYIEGLTAEGNEDALKRVAEELGYTPEDFLKAYQQAAQAQYDAETVIFKQLRETLQSKYYENNWNFLNGLNLENQQKAVNLLNDSFIRLGQDGFDFIGEVLANNTDKADEFFDALDSTNWSSIQGIIDLEQKLNQLGIEIDYTSAEWIDFKNSMKATAVFEAATASLESLRSKLAQIEELTGDIEIGSIISDEAYKRLLLLNPELEKFFLLTSQGYQFAGIGTGEGTLSDYLKSDVLGEDLQTTLDNAEKANNLALSFTEKQGQYGTFKEAAEKYSYGTSLAYVSGPKAFLKTLSDEQLQSIKVSRDSIDALTDAEIESYIAQIDDLISRQKAGEFGSESMTELFVSEIESLEKLDKAFQKGGISAEKYANRRRILINKELKELDVSEEEFENYVKRIKDTNEELAKQPHLVDALALAYYKLNNGVKDINDNWEVWQNKISKGSEEEKAQVYQQQKKAVSDVLNYDLDELMGEDNANQFIESEEGQKAIYNIGVAVDEESKKKAIDDLRDLTIQRKVELIIEVQDLDPNGDVAVKIQQFADALKDANSKLKFGDKLPEELKTHLQTMIDDTAVAASTIISLLASAGFASAELESIQNFQFKDYGNVTANEEYKKGLYGSYGIDYTSDQANLENLKKAMIQDLVGSDKLAFDFSYTGTDLGTTATGEDEAPDSSIDKQNYSEVDTEKLKEQLELERDIYHDVNIEIEKTNNLLDKLAEREDELVGNAYLENLQEQNDALEKQNEFLEEKMEIHKLEQSRLQKEIGDSSGGALTFADDGTLKGYLEYTKDSLDAIEKSRTNAAEATKKYNDAVAIYEDALEKYEKLKDGFTSQTEADLAKKAVADAQTAVDAAKLNMDNLTGSVDEQSEAYTKLLELIKEYEELVFGQMHEDQMKIEENVDKMIENEIKSLNYSIDVDLDLANAERQWNEFKWKVLEKGSRFSLFGDNILGEAEMLMQNLQTYPESISGLMNQVQKYMDIINGGGQFSAGADMAAAIENAEKYRDELMATMESVEDAIQQIQQLYLDMIDAAKDAFDDHIAQYELINEILEHNISLIEKLDGEDSFDALGRYYEKIEQNNNANLAFQKEQVEFWKQRMEAEEYGSEAWLKYKENWQNAMSELNSAVEASVDNLIAKYQNTISSIMADLTASLTGNNLGLDFLGEEWNLINENADAYLDKINSMFAIDELQGKYMDAINNTDNLEVQERLTKVMNEQVAALEEKGKLTEYDVKRANLLYEIELKKIALEEAQQNKSKMRLRRDSQGNYSYQFTADEDAIAKTQSELDQLQNSLYNLDKEAYRNNLNEVYDVYAEFQEKLKKLYADQTLSDEEREAKREMLVQQYGERINGLVTENEFIRANLYDSTFQELAKMYDTDIDHFKNMSQAEQDLLMQEMIPQWDTGIQTMIDKFSAEGGFGPIVAGTLNKLQEEHNKYEQDLEEMAEAAGINLDAIRGGYDTVHESVKQLIEQSEGELMNTWDEQLDKMSALVDSLESYDAALDGTRKAVGDLIEELNKLIAKQKEANGGTVSPSGGGNRKSNTPSNNPPTNNPPTSGGGGGGSSSPNIGGDSSNLPAPKQVILKAGNNDFYDTAYDSTSEPRQEQWKNGGTVWIGWNKNAKSWVINGRAAIYANEAAAKNHITNPSGIAWVDKKLVGLDTGGYTGQWGNEGKVAMLHEKELVLNKADTENILAAVDIVRTISGVIDNLERSISARMFDLSNLNIPQYAPPVQDTQTIEQQVHIDATFPNVQNSNEIEEAFNNLVNIASQHAFKTKR